MNSFKSFFELAKGINKGDATLWSSTYNVYRPYHVQYCEVKLTLNPIRTLWLGAVTAEYVTEEGGKKRTYYDTSGHSSLEVLEKLEEHIKEWLGEEVYAAKEESRG